MLGMFFLGLKMIFSAKNKIDEINFDINSMKNTNNGDNGYLDYYGTYRDKTTHKPLLIRWDSNGDKVIYEHGKPVYNLSHEEKLRNQKIYKYHTVVKNKYIALRKNIYGNSCLDIKTGKLFFIRLVKGNLFYMNEDGMLIRKTDGQMWKDDHDRNEKCYMNDTQTEEFIKIFNQNQIKVKQNHDIDYLFFNNYFLNDNSRLDYEVEL